jgi:5-keto-L-gluconate epimerase
MVLLYISQYQSNSCARYNYGQQGKENWMKLSVAITTPEVSAPVSVALLAGSWEEKLEKAARFGFDGVELMAVEPRTLDLAAVLQALRAYGLEAAAIASGAIFAATGISLLAKDASIRRTAVERLDELISMAIAVEARVVTLGSFRGRLAWHEQPGAADYLADVLSAAAQRAARQGVYLAVEPLNRYETDFLQNASQAMQFVSQVGNSHLGVLLDTFHMNIEEASPFDSVGQALSAGLLYHVHVADSNRRPPGQGHFDFPELLERLRSGGYAGYLSAELFPYPDPDRAAQAVAEHLRPLLL